MANPGYQVVVARLMEDGKEDLVLKADFKNQYDTLMNIIRTTYTATMITDVKSLDFKTMFRPKAIVLVTEEITKAEHVKLHSPLAKYVETGGTLILCCWFVTKSSTWGIEGLLWEFKCGWTVAEGLEVFERTNLTLNTTMVMKEKFGENAFQYLEDTYWMEAVHLEGVAKQDQVYLPTLQRDYPAVEALEIFTHATPSAFRKHGKGFLGYVGDTKLGHGTQALIVAMLEATILRSGQSHDREPARPVQPLPKRRRQSPTPLKSNIHTFFDTRPSPTPPAAPMMSAEARTLVMRGGVLDVASIARIAKDSLASTNQSTTPPPTTPVAEAKKSTTTPPSPLPVKEKTQDNSNAKDRLTQKGAGNQDTDLNHTSLDRSWYINHYKTGMPNLGRVDREQKRERVKRTGRRYADDNRRAELPPRHSPII